MNKVRNTVFAVALSTAVVSAAPSYGAVTIGSTLATNPNGTTAGPAPDTRMLSFLESSLSQPAGISAPSSGVVTSWRVRVGTDTAPIRLRAGTMGAGTVYVGGNASDVVTPPTNAVSPSYPSHMPIAAGEQLGLELYGPTTVLNIYPGAGPIGGVWRTAQTLSPGVGAAGTYDGNTPVTAATNGGLELLVNATIEPDADGDNFGDESQDPCPAVKGVYDGCVNAAPPPAATAAQAPEITLGKVKLNRKNGSAKMTVTVPGPGSLQALGKTVKPSITGVKKAGATTLVIKATGKARKKLRSKHKAKVSFTVEFIPEKNGPYATAKKTITLKKK